MKCFTFQLEGDRIKIENGITRWYRCNNYGINTYVGDPFDSKNKGPNPYKFLAVDPALLADNINCHDTRSDNKVVLWKCHAAPLANGITVLRPIAQHQTQQDALVLIQVCAHQNDWRDSKQLIAQGRQFEYGSAGPGHGLYVRSTTYEGLVVLKKGESIVFTRHWSEARALGFALHRGNETSFRISFDGTNIKTEVVDSQPKKVAAFSFKALLPDLLMCLLLIMAAALTANPLCRITNQSDTYDISHMYTGGLVGLSFFAFLTAVKTIILKINAPRVIAMQ